MLDVGRHVAFRLLVHKVYEVRIHALTPRIVSSRPRSRRLWFPQPLQHAGPPDPRHHSAGGCRASHRYRHVSWRRPHGICLGTVAVVSGAVPTRSPADSVLWLPAGQRALHRRLGWEMAHRDGQPGHPVSPLPCELHREAQRSPRQCLSGRSRRRRIALVRGPVGGRGSSAFAMRERSRCVRRAMLAPFGRYRRTGPSVSSLVPRLQA